MAWQKSRKSSVKLQLYSSKNCHVAFYSICNDVINIATKLQVTLPGVRIPVGEKYIIFSKNVQTAFETTLPPMATRVPSLGQNILIVKLPTPVHL